MDNALEEAKSWYTNLTSKSKAGLREVSSATTLKSNKEAIKFVDLYIHWAKASA
ncbi:hypothetical protein D9M68_475020 [compost metagenome]